MAKKCICEICTCGRHRCPHRPKPSRPVGQCTVTEYAEKYPAHQVNGLRSSFKPTQEMIRGSGPLSDATTNRLDTHPGHPPSTTIAKRPESAWLPFRPAERRADVRGVTRIVDYMPHQVQRVTVREPEQYKKVPGNMDLETSYIQDYPEKRAPPVQSMRSYDKHVPAGDFKGVPTYVDDYREWSLPTRDTGPVQHHYVPPSAPFDGMSTFNRDYQAKRVPMRSSMKPAESTRLSSAPLEDTTSHKMDFIPHQSQPRYVHQPMPYQRNSAPFEGLTTVQRDYTGKRASLQPSFRPDQAPMHSNQPFNDETTFRRDFQRWESSPPRPRTQQGWVQPQGNMDLATTTRIAFPAHKVQPVKPAMPIRRARSAEAPFDDQTNYKQDYRKWSSRPERRGDPTQKMYERSNVPFEGNTDYRMQFVPKYAQVPPSCAPNNNPNLSSDPFDDRTMYKLDYIPKEAAPCPAVNLPTSGYRFQRIDSRGHEMWLRNGVNGVMERSIMTPPEMIDLALA